MKSHTPGPWRQTGVNVRADDALICFATNHWANDETPESERLANARLIASAPEMLDALEGIVEWWLESGNVGDDSPLFENARAIISKAKGEA